MNQEESELEDIEVEGTQIKIPSRICTDSSIFNQIFSIETWNNVLSQEQKQKILEKLPPELRLTPEKSQESIEMLFSRKISQFNSEPLSKFFSDLSFGKYDPEVVRIKEKINKQFRKELLRRNRIYHTNLLQDVIVSSQLYLNKFDNKKEKKPTKKKLCYNSSLNKSPKTKKTLTKSSSANEINISNFKHKPQKQPANHLKKDSKDLKEKNLNDDSGAQKEANKFQSMINSKVQKEVNKKANKLIKKILKSPPRPINNESSSLSEVSVKIEDTILNVSNQSSPPLKNITNPPLVPLPLIPKEEILEKITPPPIPPLISNFIRFPEFDNIKIEGTSSSPHLSKLFIKPNNPLESSPILASQLQSPILMTPKVNLMTFPKVLPAPVLCNESKGMVKEVESSSEDEFESLEPTVIKPLPPKLNIKPKKIIKGKGAKEPSITPNLMQTQIKEENTTSGSASGGIVNKIPALNLRPIKLPPTNLVPLSSTTCKYIPSTSLASPLLQMPRFNVSSVAPTPSSSMPLFYISSTTQPHNTNISLPKLPTNNSLVEASTIISKLKAGLLLKDPPNSSPLTTIKTPTPSPLNTSPIVMSTESKIGGITKGKGAVLQSSKGVWNDKNSGDRSGLSTTIEELEGLDADLVDGFYTFEVTLSDDRQYMSFFTLLREVLCATQNHRMTFLCLDKTVRKWANNPSSTQNSWFNLVTSWNEVLITALNFLCGNYQEIHPEDFVPYIEYKYKTKFYQWIGAGRDSDANLVNLCSIWLDNLSSLPPLKSSGGGGGGEGGEEGEEDEFENEESDEIGEEVKKKYLRPKTPPPPRFITEWSVTPSTQEERKEFQTQERVRFDNPHKAFTYKMHFYESVVGPVKGVYSNQSGVTNKARGHSLLVDDRPPYVTILALVRDSVARLPNGEGTRSEICELLRDSAFLAPEASNVTLNSVVSGALDRLHYERDPCVRYDSHKKNWIYLHRDRSQEQFERLHHNRSYTKSTKFRSNNSRKSRKKNLVSSSSPGAPSQNEQDSSVINSSNSSQSSTPSTPPNLNFTKNTLNSLAPSIPQDDLKSLVSTPPTQPMPNFTKTFKTQSEELNISQNLTEESSISTISTNSMQEASKNMHVKSIPETISIDSEQSIKQEPLVSAPSSTPVLNANTQQATYSLPQGILRLPIPNLNLLENLKFMRFRNSTTTAGGTPCTLKISQPRIVLKQAFQTPGQSLVFGQAPSGQTLIFSTLPKSVPSIPTKSPNTTSSSPCPPLCQTDNTRQILSHQGRFFTLSNGKILGASPTQIFSPPPGTTTYLTGEQLGQLSAQRVSLEQIQRLGQNNIISSNLTSPTTTTVLIRANSNVGNIGGEASSTPGRHFQGIKIVPVSSGNLTIPRLVSPSEMRVNVSHQGQPPPVLQSQQEDLCISTEESSTSGVEPKID